MKHGSLGEQLAPIAEKIGAGAPPRTPLIMSPAMLDEARKMFPNADIEPNRMLTIDVDHGSRDETAIFWRCGYCGEMGEGATSHWCREDFAAGMS